MSLGVCLFFSFLYTANKSWDGGFKQRSAQKVPTFHVFWGDWGKYTWGGEFSTLPPYGAGDEYGNSFSFRFVSVL